MRNVFVRLAFLLVCLSSATTQAQQNFGLSQSLGDADLYPAIRVDYVANSNVFLEDTDETQTTSVVVRPQLLLVADSGQLGLKAQYNGEYNNTVEDVDAYSDHEFVLETRAEFSKRINVGANLNHKMQHQDLGTGYTSGIGDTVAEAITFNTTSFGVFGRYGTSRAKGNILLGFDTDRVVFTNKTAAAQLLTVGEGYTRVEPYGVFSYRLSPDLRALAELRFGSTDYEDATKNRTDVTGFIGLAIAPTGKLEGQINIGNKVTQYEQSPDLSEFVVRTALTYKLRNYSTLTLNLTRDIDELSDNAAATTASVTDLVRLNWMHEWSDRVFHRAVVSRSATDRDCPSSNEVRLLTGYELNTRLRRWLELGVGVEGETLQYSACPGIASSGDDYDRAKLGVHLRATL